jgi:hypothetical protein
MPTIDPYSVSTVPLEMYFEQTHLSVGTGFLWQDQEAFYLITNWHNVTGRDPFSGKHLSKTAGEPNRLRVTWNQKDNLGTKFAEFVPIRDGNSIPLWFIHPKHGNQVDIVALPVDRPAGADMHPINKMESDNLTLQVGMDVFILGYPFAIGPDGFPIWKRGSIASEPEILDASRPYFLIDTASRPGMSGSPVIRRSWGTHQLQGGSLMLGGRSIATKFVGVYSGRLATDDANDAQLGMAWPAHFIQEIIDSKKRDTL